jgi:hypothetical protein
MAWAELLFLFAAYLVSPFTLGYAARRVGGAIKAILTVLALTLVFAWGFFLFAYFAHLFGIQGPILELCSTIASLLLLPVGWKLFGWGASLVGEDEAARQGVYERIKSDFVQPFNKQSRTIEEMLSALHLVQDEVNEGHTRFSSLENRMDKRFSDFTQYLGEFQRVLEKMHAENLRDSVELKEFLKTVLKPSAESPASRPISPEKPVPTPRKLTAEDGRRARMGGREWQKRSADFIHNLAKTEGANIEVEVSLKKGKPDVAVRTNGKVRAVGACKAYTLWPFQPGARRTSQRTLLPSMMVVEIKSALRHKVPLFIVVVNQRTGIPWFHIIPHGELDSFERITTPSWLAEDNPPREEIERNHREFIEFLKSLA